ncbi:hypothetical protein M3Y94_01246000 [Aphelenchoides besseyi]|nr:hypothetical protein M3Y94_01246000 [Aphelenchoides besseyi]
MVADRSTATVRGHKNVKLMSSGFPSNRAIRTIVISGFHLLDHQSLREFDLGFRKALSDDRSLFLNRPKLTHDLNSVMGFGGRECVWLICCFLMPPLAIFLNSNECNVHVAVNVVVLFFFWFPGVFHALWYCFFR